MKEINHLKKNLLPFSTKFSVLAEKYDQTAYNCAELETVIDNYSMFITNKENKMKWEKLQPWELDEVSQLAEDLRRKSAVCVSLMEKYRAMKLLEGKGEMAAYFKNIESSIEREFGSFHITPASKVLLVGAGSFPMTALLIARETGAEVIGIDIDEEAVKLGQNVINAIGQGLRISLEKTLAQNLEAIGDVTHIIFSSTVASKYDILDELYERTNEHVVVAMRYGNQLKSLFNYPLKEVNEQKWELVEQVVRPKQIFDIALYQKAI
ncbi:SAM-dependent methyltransferase [Jeotgalibacillus proteolyticus]|uniref:SAM-dependent methyltransferase n=1 Tax=Jeotgalibacillus proteolyticus TaxID=2082395 RepID=A0A2S5GBX0_9BACL|nr:SAM-dependent methyltransferase [Jeotgalibacillus proteolyticus]PPA70393.1 SAM-dependent methyltransferase [Jeotgalibacillus proteolyticus]